MCALLAIGVSTGGCDLPNPAAVQNVDQASPSFTELEAPLLLGDFSISIPATNGWGQTSATYWQATGIPVPESSWVHVEVIGGVTYSANGDCYRASLPCGAPLDGQTTGPLFPGGASRVHVGNLRLDAPPPIGTTGVNRYFLYPRNGTEQTALSAYGLAFHRDPRTIWVRRDITFSGSWNPITAVHDGFEYFLGGNQSLRVSRVPRPLRITGPERVAPDERATFTAEIVGPFQLRRPFGAGSGYLPLIYWLYHPGDTLPQPRSGQGQRVSACDNQMECDYDPPSAGRMAAWAYVEGNSVEHRSQVVRIDSARLELTCDRYSVDRGESINCSAAAKPSGKLDSIRWEFADTAGHTITGPPDVAVWGGRMVVGGTIRARAKLNGVPVADDTAIIVRARRWSTIRLRARQNTYPPGHLPSPELVTVPGHLGDSHADTVVALPVYEVTSGPNAGWWYLEQQIREFGWVVHINEAAFASGSAWYNLQTGGAYVLPSGVVVPNGRCDSHHIPTMRQLTREHEGLGSSSLTSHADAARMYLQTNQPQNILERTMAYGPDLVGFTFYQSAVATYVDIASAMEAFSAPHTNDDPAGVVDLAPFPCYARPWWP